MKDNACWIYDVLGNVIHQAIVDYSKGRGEYYHDARNFLFTDSLDRFIKRWRLEENVSIRSIRKFAKNYNKLVRKNGRRINERENGDNEL